MKCIKYASGEEVDPSALVLTNQLLLLAKKSPKGGSDDRMATSLRQFIQQNQPCTVLEATAI